MGNQLKWLVKNFNCNKQVIEDYDVLKYYEEYIKKLKKNCDTKEEFSEKLKREMMSQYWSRSEYELIIELSDDNRVFLNPWCGCYEPEKARIDVTNDTSFDWRGFAEKHIERQVYRDKAKIDIYEQLMYVWEDFIDYCWYTRLKYERDDAKFHKE
jgi:hypothetical protein